MSKAAADYPLALVDINPGGESFVVDAEWMKELEKLISTIKRGESKRLGTGKSITEREPFVPLVP